MRRIIFSFLVFLSAIISFTICALPVAGSASAQAGTPVSETAGWILHDDAKGFAMEAPAGWNFSSESRAGRILVQGPRGEQVVVWPGSIQQTLDARGAAALVQQLARQVDGQMPWGAAAATGGAVRTIGKGSRMSGVAMMRWSSGEGGTSLLFYCVEAPSSAYGAETGTFAAILKSFRVVQDAPSAANPSGPIKFTPWTEPHENAYTISVPQGWKVVGGLYRLSATDIRSGVTMASPDGQ